MVLVPERRNKKILFKGFKKEALSSFFVFSKWVVFFVMYQTAIEKNFCFHLRIDTFITRDSLWSPNYFHKLFFSIILTYRLWIKGWKNIEALWILKGYRLRSQLQAILIDINRFYFSIFFQGIVLTL